MFLAVVVVVDAYETKTIESNPSAREDGEYDVLGLVHSVHHTSSCTCSVRMAGKKTNEQQRQQRTLRVTCLAIFVSTFIRRAQDRVGLYFQYHLSIHLQRKRC